MEGLYSSYYFVLMICYGGLSCLVLFFDVNQVTPGSPAHRAGFIPSDVVIKFDGKPVQSIKEVLGYPVIFLLLYLFI